MEIIKNDIIILSAAVSDINFANKNLSKTIFQNTYLATRVLEIMKNQNKKLLIFISSIYVNGKNMDVYKISKYTSELIIRNFSKKFNTNFTILRLPTICGNNNRSADVISIFKKNILQGKNIIVNGDGKQTRNFLFSRDLGKSFFKLLNKKYQNKVVNVFSNYNYNIKNLAKIFGNINKKSKIIFKRREIRYDDFDLRYIKFKDKSITFQIKNKLSFERKIINFVKSK
jgi:Nucleoside-diphosphate-sugar epimerases